MQMWHSLFPSIWYLRWYL